MTMRYLLDENVDPMIRRELQSREATMVVWRVGDLTAPPYGMLDPDILVWCQQNSFVLVTNNRKSMPRHLRDHIAQGRHVPGIIIINDDMSVGDTIEQLILIWGAAKENEYRDIMLYLPLL